MATIQTKLKRALFWTAGPLLLVLVVLILAATVLLTTAPGRQWLVVRAVDWANQSEVLKEKQITINSQGLRWPELNQLTIKSLSIYQNEELWLGIKDFSTNIDLLAAWQGNYHLRHLTAAWLYYDQAVTARFTSSADAPEKSSAEPFTLPELPNIEAPVINLKQVVLHNLLPAEIAGQTIENPLAYSLRAKLHINQAAGLTSQIDIKPLKTGLPAIQLQAATNRLKTWNITGLIKESDRGLVSDLLKIPAGELIDAHFSLAVHYEKDKIHAAIEEFTLPLAGFDIGLNGKAALSLPAQVTENQPPFELKVTDVNLRVNNTEHEVEAEVSPPHINARLNLNSFPLAILNPWVPQIEHGDLTANVEISETLNNPTVNGSLDLRTHWTDLPLNLRTQISGSQQRFTVKNLNAEFAEARASADGVIDTVGDKTKLTFAVQKITTELISTLPLELELPPEFSAELVNAAGTLTGTLKAPKGSAKAQITGVYQQESFDLHADADLNQTLIDIRSLTLDLPTGSSFVQGQFDYNTLSGKLSAKLKDIPLELLTLVNTPPPANLTGRLNGELQYSGNIKTPTLTSTLSLNGQYGTLPFAIDTQADFNENRLTIPAITVIADTNQVLQAEGFYQIDTQQFDANLTAERLPTELLDLANIALPHGNFTSKIHLTGSPQAPSLNASAEYETEVSGYNAEGDFIAQPLRLELTAEIEQEFLAITSDIKRGNLPDEHIQLNAQIDSFLQKVTGGSNTPWAELPLNVNLKANSRLGTLGLLLDPEINQMSGVIDANIDVSGKINKPEAQGFIAISDANYSNRLTGTRLQQFACLIDASTNDFTITDCQGTDGGKGRYRISGAIQLPITQPNSKIDLTINAQHASVIDRSDIESEATGELTITGDLTELLAKGELEVTPFNAIVDVNLGTEPPSIEVREVAAEEDSEASEPLFAMPKVNFDLSIIARNQAYLRGRGLEAELSGRIKLVGSIDEPEYVGEFNTVRGKFEVFGKEFQLTEGQVSFVNNSIAMIIIGTYVEDSRTITAQISGQNQDLVINLSSAPAMPEDEILSYIIFGESLDDISAFKAIQLASAVKTLKGGSSDGFDPLAMTRNFLGVDTISIDNESTEDGNSGVNVGVGKYLNDQVYLELERTPNPSQPWKGSLEIELTPNLKLQSSTGGKSGLDSAEIIWTHDY